MGKKIKIDATETDTDTSRRHRSARVPEGDYIVKVNNSEIKTNKAEDGKYILWECIIMQPAKYKGKRLSGITSLKKDALWSLRNLIHAATGKNIAGKVVTFDPETVYGKLVGAAVSDNEYTDKNDNTVISSRIDSFFPREEAAMGGDEEDVEDEDDDEDVEEEEDLEEEDEEEEEKPKKKKKKRVEEDEDDDEDLEEVDIEEV